MRSLKLKYWELHNTEDWNEALPDPRLAVTRWTGWDGGRMYAGRHVTTWSFPEPDNINAAIWHNKPHHIEGISYQMWYRDRARGGWFSLYYIDDNNRTVFDWYINQTAIWASWDHPKSTKPRERISGIELDSRRWTGEVGKTQHTFEERLHLQGFFSKLVDKGVDPKYVERIVGNVRPEARAFEYYREMCDEE